MASKSPHEPFAGEALEEALEILHNNVDRVRALYEQYFLGIQKQPPTHGHTDLERRFRELSQIQIRNTALRYRFATLQQKFGAYNTYWRRTLRQIENGTYLRNLQKLGRQAAQTGESIPEEILARMPKLMREQVRRDREAALALASRREAREPQPDAADAEWKVRSPGTVGNAHVLDEFDPELDLDACFAALMAEDDPRPEASPSAKGTRTKEQQVPPEPALARTSSRPAFDLPTEAEMMRSAHARAKAYETEINLRSLVSPSQTGEVVPPGVTRRLAETGDIDYASPARASTNLSSEHGTGVTPPLTPGQNTRATTATKATTLIKPIKPTPATPSGTPSAPPATPRAAPSQKTMPLRFTPGQTPNAPVTVESLDGTFPREPRDTQPDRPPESRPRPTAAPAHGQTQRLGVEPPRRVGTPPPIPPVRPSSRSVPTVKTPPGMTDAEVNALYTKYVKAKELVGEKAEPYAKLVQTISSQAPKILERYKAKAVEFSVVVKDNQVVLRAKPK